jgi:hypothetical protein
MVTRKYITFFSLLAIVLNSIYIWIYYGDSIVIYYHDYDLSEYFEISNSDDDTEFVDEIRKLCPLYKNKISINCISLLEKETGLQHKSESKFDSELLSDCSACKGMKRVINYHTFWQVNKGLSNTYHRILNLSILSYFYTQNVCCTKLNVWLSNDPLADNIISDLAIKYRYFIDKQFLIIKKLNVPQLCQGTIFERHDVCKASYNMKNKKKVVAYSDFVRFLLLNKYGGIWNDGDVFFLKDLKPFWNSNFVTRWSYKYYYNTATTGCSNFQTFVPIMEYLMDKYPDATDFINQLLGVGLTRAVGAINNGQLYKYKDLIVFHSYIFDPIWIQADLGIYQREADKEFKTYNTAYKALKRTSRLKEIDFSPKNIFNLSFAYHLHSGHFESSIESNSYFSYFERFYSKYFNRVLN